MEPLAHKLAYSVVCCRRLRRPDRRAEPQEIANAYAAPEFAEFLYRDPIGISCSQQASDACACDSGHWNSFLFEDLQDSQVGKAPGETAAQCQRHTCACAGP